MLHLLQTRPFKVLTTFPLQIQSSWQLSLGAAPLPNTVAPSSDSLDINTSTVQSGPLLLIHHSYPTLVSKPLIPHLPILYLLSLLPHHRPLLLAFLLPPLPPDFLRVPQWNAGGLQSRSTELLHFLLCHPVDLICIQEPNLNTSSSFWILCSAF